MTESDSERVVYESRPLRGGSSTNLRRVSELFAIGLVLIGMAYAVKAVFRLESMTVVLPQILVAAGVWWLVVAVTRPAARRITISERELVVTNRRGDQRYRWAQTEKLAFRKSWVLNTNEFRVERRPGVDDAFLLPRVAKVTWTRIVEDLGRAAQAHGVEVKSK